MGSPEDELGELRGRVVLLKERVRILEERQAELNEAYCTAQALATEANIEAGRLRLWMQRFVASGGFGTPIGLWEEVLQLTGTTLEKDVDAP